MRYKCHDHERVRQSNEHYNRLVVKIFNPDGKLARIFNKLPPHGEVITETGILNQLSKIADDLEKNLPELEYRMVQVRGASAHVAQYNFVYEGLRPDVEQSK